MQAVPKLLETIPGAAFVDAVLPPLLKAADDRVPNVKFNLCKVLQVRARARVGKCDRRATESVTACGAADRPRHVSVRAPRSGRSVTGQCGVQDLAPALANFKAAVTGQVTPILKMLQEDVDTDVRYYADEARQHYTE